MVTQTCNWHQSNVDNHITAKLQIKTVTLLFTSYILSCFEAVVQKNWTKVHVTIMKINLGIQ